MTDGEFSYKDYSSQSQRATPYIGQDDAPTKVSKLFTAAPTGISWADAGFVQPFLNRLNTTLPSARPSMWPPLQQSAHQHRRRRPHQYERNFVHHPR